MRCWWAPVSVRSEPTKTRTVPFPAPAVQLSALSTHTSMPTALQMKGKRAAARCPESHQAILRDKQSPHHKLK